MTIKTKLFLLGFVAVFALAATFGVNLYGSARLNKATRSTQYVLNAKLSLLQSRREEQEFLTRKNPAAFERAMKDIEEARRDLMNAEQTVPALADDLDPVLALIENHVQVFTQAAESVRRMGLTEKEGLRGKLRDAIHKVESVVTTRDDDSLLAALLMLRRREKDFIIRGDPGYLDKFRKDMTTMRANVLTSPAIPISEKSTINDLLDEYETAFGEYVVLAGEIRDHEQRFSALAEQVDSMLREITIDQMAAHQNLQDTLERTNLIVGLVAGLLLIGGVFQLSRSIITPLSMLRECSRAVASGEHAACVDYGFSGELEDLRSDVVLMVENLKESMDNAELQSAEARKRSQEAEEAMQTAEQEKERVANLLHKMSGVASKANTISRQMADSAHQLSEQAQSITAGTDIQRHRASETATAMAEMNATVLEVARNSSDAAEGADSARQLASRGADIVGDAERASAEVSRRTVLMKQSLGELGGQVDGIGTIMQVIDDIADQTNLLALNAAIEAARAGDAGRGFAVVADEVRKLAEKTMTATKEVGTAVSGIQERTRENIETMDGAAQAVEKSAALAGEAGSSLREILSVVERTADQVRSIATAAEQQSATSEEINIATEEVNRISNETAEGISDSVDAINVIAGLAQELRQLIEELETTT